MDKHLFIQEGITIPEHEIEISTSRSGGPGGQHTNKTDTRITARWNVRTTQALTEQQKELVLKNLATQLTHDGDLIVHNSASRSQQTNKKMALATLAQKIRRALYVPKKRMATKVSKAAQAERLQAKKRHGLIKKLRKMSKRYDSD